MKKAQLLLELEQAQKRIAELELAAAKHAPTKKVTASTRSKFAGQGWQEKEAFYQAFIEQSHDGIVILDEHGNVSTWNSAQESITGLPREEVIGQKYWDVQYRLFSPELRAKLSPEKIKDALQNAFTTGEYHSLRKLREVEILSVDGEKKFIQVSPFSVKTSDGYSIGLTTRDITNQKKAFDTILEDEERFSLIFHASPSQMAITDFNNGQYIDVNKSFLQTFGYTREEVIGRTASELNLFFDPNQRAALLEKMSRQGYLREEDVLVRTKTGSLRHGVFSGEYIQVHEHRFLLTVMNDITERKQAEEKLRSSEERHRNLIENINEAVVEVDEQGRYCYISPSYFYLSGYTPEEELGSSVIAHVHPDDLPALIQELERFTGSTLPAMTYRIRAKNGEWRWVETSGKPYRLVSGEQRVIGVMRDITDRKLVEEKLRQSEARLQGFLDAAPDAMVIADAEGKIILANIQTEVLFGYTREELLKMVVEQLVPQHARGIHPQRRANFTKRPARTLEGVTREINALRKDRSEFSAEISLSQHTMGKDKVILSAIRDITERKKAEAALQRNQIALLETQNIAKLQNWIADFKTGVIEIGPGYDQILGWPAGTYPLTEIAQIVHPLDAQFVEKAWVQAADNNPVDIEYRVLINGELKWVHVMTYEDATEDGKFRGFTQDITKRKQAEVLAYNQRNLARLASTVTTDEEAWPNCLEAAMEISGMDSGGIYMFDAERSVLKLAYHKGLGADFIQVVSRYPADAPNAQMVLAGMMFYFDDAELATQKHHKDEGLRSLAVIPVIDHGHVLGCINIASHSLLYVPEISRQALETIVAEIGNVISHLRTEMLLREIREQLLEAQELAHIGNWEWDLKEQTLRWSDEVYRIFGVTPAEFTPTVESFESAIHPEDREDFLKQRTKMLENEQIANIDHRIILPNGQVRHVQERTRIILDANGTMIRVIGTVQDITGRKLAEESIWKSTQLLNESQAIANLGSWTADLRTGVFDATPEGARLVGWTPGLHNGEELMAVIHPDDREFMQTSWEAAMHGAPYDIEHRILLHGEIRWLHITAKVTFDKDGVPISALGVTQDITDRKKADEARRESDARYRLLAENISDVIWILDIETSTYLYVSPSVLQLRGFSVKEVTEQDLASSLTPTSAKHLNEVMASRIKEFQQGMRTSYTDEIEQPCKDGSTVWTETTTRFVKNPETGHIEVYGVSRDITERKKAEDSIHQIEKRNTALIENAPDGIAMVDANGIFLFASPSAYRMFGYTADKIVGTHSREKIHPQDIPLLDLLRIKLQNSPEEPQKLEYRFLHMDGSYHWLESTYTNMFNEPSVRGIVINFRDITDRKLTEEINRQQSEQLRLLYEASQQLNRTLDVQEIYQTICDFMMIIAPSDTLFISAFDSETQLITCKAYWMQDKWLDVSIFPSIPLEEEGKGTQSMVIRSGEALLSNDYQKLIKSAQNVYYVEGDTNEIVDEDPPEDEITRSALIVPLKSGGQVKGVIQVASYHLNAYTESQLKLLEALALHITSAEQNAVLYTQLLSELNERKQAEEALHASNETAQAILNASTESVFLMDIDGKVIATNETTATRLGKQVSEIVGTNIYDLLPAETAKLRKERVESVVREHKPLIFDDERYGVWIENSIYPIFDSDGEVRRVAVYGRDVTERRQGEEALRNREELYRLISTINADYVFSENLDVEGNPQIKWVGGGFESITGYTVDEYIAKGGWLSIVHPDDRERDAHDLESLKNNQKIIDTLRMIHKNGDVRWVQVHANPLWDLEQQKLTGIYGAVQDVTERIKAEAALHASEEKYRVLVESLDNVIATVDGTGKFLYMNDMAAGQLGRPAETLVGKTMHELFPERVASQQMAHVQQVIKEDNGNVFEAMSIVRGEPHWYRTSIQPIHDEDGSVSQVLINSTDIHDLKTTQQKLQELNRTLEERVKQRTAEVQDLYDNAPAGYHSLDANGNVILINQTELNWLGYSREEVVGLPLANLFTAASAVKLRENFPEFKKRGWLRDLEFEFVRKDGTVFPILVNAVAVYDENRNYILSRSTVLDNTDQKLAGEAMRNANLEMARAMRMKDEFLASMSHELRTPLNGILGLSEALQEDVYGPLNEKQKATVIHIENSGRHLLDLISDILDVSKIEAGKFELEMLPCSLGDICQSSIHLTKGMAAKKRQNVSFNMSPASITVNGDGRRLKQILVNLLSNAVKFTHEEGSLGLEVVENAIDNIVYISVWDKGIGISTDDIKKLFQPFVQLDSSLSRQQTGTGLGLTLVQRLVEMHGGSIEIQSTPGQGSRFTVALPCLPSDAVTNTDKLTFKSRFHYALIVEDESMDASHLARYCKALGITPVIHSTGKDAFERVIATRPNIVFLDLHLPDLSGWEVLEQLKASPETKHLPVVITSIEDDKQRASQLNADGYLVKFFSVSDMQNVLSAIQKTSSPSDSHSKKTDKPIATVMIVDDNEVNIETVFDYLGAKNFNVVSAKSGVEFLTTAPRLRPDLVLMDIQMPEMDGLETIRRLRSHTDQELAAIPVIALTALAMPGDRENCIEAGADEYITKPFRLSEITEVITQMLEDKKRKL
ncbi:MAG: PAS domain S-box protein [Anaerolineales bacterium]